jgi:hypothetical protein
MRGSNVDDIVDVSTSSMRYLHADCVLRLLRCERDNSDAMLTSLSELPNEAPLLSQNAPSSFLGALA